MKLSIITVVYNNLIGLQRTAASILPLPEKMEWIIIDGASSDGTKEFIASLSSQNITFISEPDHGIFDAMNKGIPLASGEYLIFMNSGDYFNRDALLSIEYLHIQPFDIVVYNYIPVDAKLNNGYARSLNGINQLCKYDCIPHQSTLIKKQVFDLIGNYDLSYRYAGDYDFFMRAYRHGSAIEFIHSHFLSYFVQDGISSNLHLSLQHWEENKRIQIKYCGTFSKKLMLIYYIKWIISFLPFKNLLESKLRTLLFKRRHIQ